MNKIQWYQLLKLKRRGTWKVFRGKFSAVFSGPWAQDRACLFINIMNNELSEKIKAANGPKKSLK